MRFMKIALATLFLVAFVFASLAFAQQKPAAAPAQEAYGVMDLLIKPGMGWEWESYLKRDLVPVAKKAGVTQLLISKTEGFGIGDRYSIMWPIKNLAELDMPDPIEKAMGTDGLAVYLSHIQRCVEGARVYALITHPELSIPAKPGYVHKMGVTLTATIAPGRTDEYEKTAKEMVALFAKTNSKAVYAGQVGFGGNINQYMFSVFVDSFAELGQFVQGITKAAAEAKLPSETGIVTNLETQTFKTLPELSIE